jgi:hypothetical protein
MPWREADPDIDGDKAFDWGCRIWTGWTIDNTPMTRWQGRATTVRRRVWEEANGPVPEGKQVGCYCGSRLCIRLSHLEPMTRSEIQIVWGRARLCRGTALLAVGAVGKGIHPAVVADAYNVSERTLRAILAGEHWTTREEPAS